MSTRRTLRVGGQSIVGLALTTPTVALSLTSGSLYEGNAAVYAVTLSRPWVDDVEITYATSNGTAAAGTDYTSTSGTLTIPAGLTVGTITVPTTLRSGAQLSRTFTLTLTSALDAGGDQLPRTTSAVVTTILDTAAAPTLPTLSVAAVAPANEGDPLTFRVTASFAPTADITFSYATSNGSAISGTDYTAASGTGTLSAANLTEDLVVTTTERAGFQGARTVVMTISAAASGGDAVTIASPVATGTIAETEPLTGDHAYYETLLARADVRTASCFSFRDAPKLLKANAGGYAQSTAAVIPVTITYDPASDTNPNAQDACKVVIPSFVPVSTGHILSSSMTDTQDTLPVLPNNIVATMSFRVDDEIVTVTNQPTVVSDPFYGTVKISRGQFGTTAVAHTAGVQCQRSCNSTPTQVWFPCNIPKGDVSYFITWDAYFTDSWQSWSEASLKTFNFQANGSKIWMEHRTMFLGGLNWPPNSPAPGFNRATDAYAPDIRSYQPIWNGTAATWADTDGNMRGPDNYSGSSAQPILQTSNNSLLNYQIVRGNEWARWMVQLDSRAADWDRWRLWVSTENRDPSLIYDVLVSIPPKTLKIDQFTLEFNSSRVTHVRGPGLGYDLVAYIKNFAVLENAGGPGADWASLRVRP